MDTYNIKKNLNDNLCTDPNECSNGGIIENTNNGECYKVIKKNAEKSGLKEKVDKMGVNECIKKLNANLKCAQTNEIDDWYLNCKSEWEDENNGDVHNEIKHTCKTEQAALETIVAYCTNKDRETEKDTDGICQPEYKTNTQLETKKYENTNGVKMMLGKLMSNDSNIRDIDCGDCNKKQISIKNEKNFNRYFENSLKIKTRDRTKFINCHEYSKLLKDCDNDKNVDRDALETLYQKFLSGEEIFPESKNLSKGEQHKIIKAALCKIAKDNIKKQTIQQMLVDFNNWWKENVFGESGFQQLIYIISLFLCLLLKFNILKKFNFPNLDYASTILIILSFILIIGSFIIFVGEYNIANNIANIVFYIFTISILVSMVIRCISLSLHKNGTWLSICIGCIIALLSFKFTMNLSQDIGFIDIIILLIIIIISFYISFKVYFNKFVGSIFILIIILFISYLFLIGNDEANSYIMKIYFYIIVFIILICINVITSQADLYERVMGIILKPFGKNDNKAYVMVLLIIYFILGLSDSFVTVMSPQMSLFIMIILRLILKRWYEPLNGMFAAISGYSMDINEGKKGLTTNSEILTFNKLTNLFTNN